MRASLVFFPWERRYKFNFFHRCSTIQLFFLCRFSPLLPSLPSFLLQSVLFCGLLSLLVIYLGEFFSTAVAIGLPHSFNGYLIFRSMKLPYFI